MTTDGQAHADDERNSVQEAAGEENVLHEKPRKKTPEEEEVDRIWEAYKMLLTWMREDGLEFDDNGEMKWGLPSAPDRPGYTPSDDSDSHDNRVLRAIRLFYVSRINSLVELLDADPPDDENIFLAYEQLLSWLDEYGEVPREIWDELGNLIGDRSAALKARLEKDRGALLRGFVYCGKCGMKARTAYTRKTNSSGEPLHYLSYCCTSKRDPQKGIEKPCGNKRLREEIINKLSWDQVMAYLSKPQEVIRRVRERIGRPERIESLEYLKELLNERLIELNEGIESAVWWISSKRHGDSLRPFFEKNLIESKNQRLSILEGLRRVERQFEIIEQMKIDETKAKEIGQVIIQYKDKFPNSVRTAVIKALHAKISFLNDGIDIVVNVSYNPPKPEEAKGEDKSNDEGEQRAQSTIEGQQADGDHL